MFNFPLSSFHFFIGGVGFTVFLFFIVLIPVAQTHRKFYEAIETILSPAEQHFYKVLKSVVDERTIIFVKVRLADLVKVNRKIKKQYFWTYHSKIAQKHIDYILIDPITFKLICAIELDDKSHLKFDRFKRDRFVNSVMHKTGIPLVRFKVRRRYNRDEIREKLNPYLTYGFRKYTF